MLLPKNLLFQLGKTNCKLHIQRSGFIFLGEKTHNIECLYLSSVYILNHTGLKRFMHPNVHSNIIYNCQDMEAT